MKKTPTRKARRTHSLSSGHGAVGARSQPSPPASRSEQAPRMSLAAFILNIPPGDASDELDFARVQ